MPSTSFSRYFKAGLWLSLVCLDRSGCSSSCLEVQASCSAASTRSLLFSCAGDAENESGVRALVRTLWIFVPGHSKHEQVVGWRRTKGLTLADLAHIRLIGISKDAGNYLPPSVDRFVTTFDFESETLMAPHYQGVYLDNLAAIIKYWKTDKLVLSHVHCMLLDLASHAFVYYHVFCLKQEEKFKNDLLGSKRQEALDAYFTANEIADCDREIVMYLADVVRMQQVEDHLKMTGRADGQSSPRIRLSYMPRQIFQSKQKHRTLSFSSRNLRTPTRPGRSRASTIDSDS
eukprot:m.127780 g.127780  ORF g.127780 m.127780 type:complete len:288 (+) comp9733_c0_seq3:1542-2405(+)